MNPAHAFGMALRYYRAKLKVSQERLAQESGLDRSYISLLERGLRQPSLTTMIQIAKVFDISSIELLSKVEEMLNENHQD